MMLTYVLCASCILTSSPLSAFADSPQKSPIAARDSPHRSPAGAADAEPEAKVFVPAWQISKSSTLSTFAECQDFLNNITPHGHASVVKEMSDAVHSVAVKDKP